MHESTNLNSFFDALALNLAEKVTAIVMENVKREVASIVLNNSDFCWSEEEAAGKLKMSVETLARKRKAKEIGCSYSIPPTKFDGRGRALNGRPVYMRHHILSYLLKYEVSPAYSGKGYITFENVYEFEKKGGVAA